MTSVNFSNALPDVLAIKKPVTTSKSIMNKRVHEFLPKEQTVFGPLETNTIRLDVADNLSVLLPEESHFECKVTIQSGSAALPYFDVIGPLALIRRAEIRLRSGNQIQVYENCNRYWAMKHATGEMDLSSYWNEGKTHYHTDQIDNTHKSSTLRLGTVYVDSVGKWLRGTDATGVSLASKVIVGDYIFLEQAGFHVRVDKIVGEQIEFFTNLGAGTFTDLAYLIRYDSSTNNSLSGTSDPYTFRLPMTFFDNTIPLMLLTGGFQIILELESAARAFVCHEHMTFNSSTTPVEVKYTVSGFKYVAMLMQPHPDIAATYLRRFQEETGITFSIPSVRTRRASHAKGNSDAVLSVDFGVRSANKLYAICQASNWADADDYVTRFNRSLSSFLKSGITSYIVKVGAERYPDIKVDCSGVGRLAYNQLKMVTQRNPMFGYDEWVDTIYRYTPDSTGNNTYTDSLKFVMAVDLARDNGRGSNLVGTDLSRVSLNLELTRDVTFENKVLVGDPVFFMFCEHDAYLRLSVRDVQVII